jgi:S1-C subfamily serine protease
VVRVIAPEGEGTSYGSGTLVDVRGDYGLVLTNWHVVADATGTVEVVFPDGFRSAARVITTDRVWDLAALAIWKPNVAPVKLSARAPQPGEPLTIAGYGSGSYRAVTGTCTQYVAPGMNKPYEMVELSVAARQGDSGGPILNSQGELAGVLWGAGWGTTSGSYSGRVAAFVAAIMPPPGVGEESQIAQASSTPQAGPVVPVDYNAPVAQGPRARGIVSDHQTTAARTAGATSGGVSNVAGSTAADDTHSATQQSSVVEEIELFLAFVGAVALVMHAVRLVLPGK